MTAWDVLTEAQRAVAARVLDEEGARREHLVVSLSGAHAYGFPSPDSDLDLKCFHVAPTAHLLGLTPGRAATVDRLEVLEGVEVDYTSNELQQALTGVLAGNGNYVERVLSRFALRAGPLLEGLRPLVRGALSRRLHRHYAGFARGQLREWERTGFASAKRLLYVLRTALTGVHVLRTGELETDVTGLLGEYGLADAAELVAHKRRGEKADLPADLAAGWRARVDGLFARLDAACQASPLPEAPPNAEALEAWLLEVRRGR